MSSDEQGTEATLASSSGPDWPALNATNEPDRAAIGYWVLDEFVYDDVADEWNASVGVLAAVSGSLGLSPAAAYNDSMAAGPNASAAGFLNITADLDVRYAMPLYGYIMPFLVVVTMCANTLIVIVLSKKHMRTPTNFVLMAMALSDMFTLMFPAPWLLYLYTFGNHNRPLRPLAACYAYNFMNEVIPALFHTASIWLTLALAIQRYIYVCHPPLARTWCTMERYANRLRFKQHSTPVLTIQSKNVVMR